MFGECAKQRFAYFEQAVLCHREAGMATGLLSGCVAVRLLKSDLSACKLLEKQFTYPY